MPIVTREGFRRMLEAASAGGWAYPAVNVHDLSSVNAAIEGFAAAGSDGILQVHPDAAAFVAGTVEHCADGALAMAEHSRRVAARCPVGIALHTDHCSSAFLDVFLRPLIAESARRAREGRPPLFNSHMFDGSDLPLGENLSRSLEFLRLCSAAGLALEMEVGVMGAESGAGGGKRLFSTPEDFLAVHRTLAGEPGAEFLVAPAFGNAHGVYRPGEVVLRPEVLRGCQDALAARHGPGARFRLVFHGGSGSSREDVRAAVGHGVVKMNFDSDTQYAFSRGVFDHMMTRYDGVLRIDGDVGRRMDSFQETWLRRGMDRMRDKVADLCRLLGCAGRSTAGGVR